MNAILSVSLAIHVVGAALLVGGVFFFRVILIKYAKREGGLDDKLKEVLSKRWIHLVWSLLAVMLVTGVLQLVMLLDVWKDSSTLPHMIFGAKFLVFLGIVAVTLMSTLARNNGEKRQALLQINVVLGILILFLSVFLSRSY